MSGKEFERLLQVNGKKIDNSKKTIEESAQRFNKKFKKIIKAI
ncbi:MAG: hypothetical protein QF824_02345 [Candidatus Woesearchaeota archaeon]|jgi:hypothetical protein|nr:hypothetical protein [Candidatus Woesearchaeota archaeon]|tara:strand:- start:259 stop:387 length:129 start_codon:yes stop_codon:yes gene_type:complete